jgi:hypothetical protein
MKQFDQQFAENVRDVFDNFYEEVDAGAIADIQKRLSGTSRTRIIPLWSGKVWAGAAAAAAVLVALGGFFFLLAPEPQQLMVSSPVHHTEPSSIVSENVISITVSAENQLTTAQADRQEKTHIKQTPKIISKDNISVIDPEESVEEIISREIDDQEEPGIMLPSLRRAVSSTYHHPEIAINTPSPESSSLSLALGSSLAYIPEGNASGVGVNAGLIYQRQLLPNVSLAAGGLFSYNQFEWVNTAEREQKLQDQIFGNFEFIEYSGNNEYEMYLLDIPLNAYFTLNENSRGSLFLGAGISSFIYFGESFSSEYWARFGSSGVGMSHVAMVEDHETYKAFSRFDLARIINFSMGYKLNSARGVFIIEPYVKYPIDAITSREIRLGMGGVSFKAVIR